MNNTLISHIEHAIAGALLWTVPLALAGIPTSITNLTVGAVIGLVWSLVRGFISTYNAG